MGPSRCVALPQLTPLSLAAWLAPSSMPEESRGHGEEVVVMYQESFRQSLSSQGRIFRAGGDGTDRCDTGASSSPAAAPSLPRRDPAQTTPRTAAASGVPQKTQRTTLPTAWNCPSCRSGTG